MAALGIWFWINPVSFGDAGPARATSICATSTVILGHRVPLGSSGLRMASIVLYSLFLIPVLNLILPLGFFIGVFIWYQPYRSTLPADSPTPPPNIRATVVSLIMLFAINLIFVLDIEMTIQQNHALQAPGESLWTFGQILAILLLVLPLRDLLEAVLERSDKRRRGEHTESLRSAIREKATTTTIRDLIRKGADVNVESTNSEYSTVLQLAVSRDDTEFVKDLPANGADPNMRGVNGIVREARTHRIVGAGREGMAALHMACCHGHGEIVKHLLEQGAKTHISAFRTGHSDIARQLLEKKALSNTHGDEEASALYMAASAGYADMTEFLLVTGSDPNKSGNNAFSLPQVAEVGIEGKSGSPLYAASAAGHAKIVQLLLESGADANMKGENKLYLSGRV
ncbi:ankyrin repeat-containing domain protein [Mycena capillaripes]|nr:ankyrin repeat-containing domain protein [Mycena capillaripes]